MKRRKQLSNLGTFLEKKITSKEDISQLLNIYTIQEQLNISKLDTLNSDKLDTLSGGNSGK